MEFAAVDTALVASGAFLMLGLVSGTWKYAHIARSRDAVAPMYVDITHRSSLMYSFACLVLWAMAARSSFSDGLNLAAVIVSVAFYAAAVLTYVVHGVLRDTDNQLAVPHRLGNRTLAPWLVRGFMISLVIGEIGGAGVLFAGLIAGL